MTYEVRWTKTALKSLKKIGRNDAERIINRVEEIKQNPFKYVKKLKGLPFYTLRVGRYRVILVIETGKLVVFVLEVESRRRVYKKLK